MESLGSFSAVNVVMSGLNVIVNLAGAVVAHHPIDQQGNANRTSLAVKLQWP